MLGIGKPVLRFTKVGWIVAGHSKVKSVEVCNLVSNFSVQEQLERFRILEDCPMQRT